MPTTIPYGDNNINVLSPSSTSAGGQLIINNDIALSNAIDTKLPLSGGTLSGNIAANNFVTGGGEFSGSYIATDNSNGIYFYNPGNNVIGQITSSGGFVATTISGTNGSFTSLTATTYSGGTFQSPVNFGANSITNSPTLTTVKGVSIDNSGSVIPSSGVVASTYIPANYTITNWAVISTDDTSGSITVDLQTVASGSFVPNSTSGATSIVGAGTKPNISSNVYAHAAPSSWTSAQLSSGTYLLFVVSAVTSLKYVRIELTLTPR